MQTQTHTRARARTHARTHPQYTQGTYSIDGLFQRGNSRPEIVAWNGLLGVQLPK